MGRYILKFPNGKYLEWSTVVDAPATHLMSREDFEEDYRDRHGSDGMDEFARRMERADRTGCSAMNGMTLEDCIDGNRAGPREGCISLDEIMRMYSYPQVAEEIST